MIIEKINKLLIHWPTGGGATRPLQRDGCMEELHRDPTVGSCPKVWTRGQKWKKWC